MVPPILPDLAQGSEVVMLDEEFWSDVAIIRLAVPFSFYTRRWFYKSRTRSDYLPGVVSVGGTWYVWPPISFNQAFEENGLAVAKQNGEYPSMEAAMAACVLIYG